MSDARADLPCSIGPIAQYHENSKYYSAIRPAANKVVDNQLPHVTIQMPVYKESLESVLYAALPGTLSSR